MTFPVMSVILYGALMQLVWWLGECGMRVTWPDFMKFSSPSPDTEACLFLVSCIPFHLPVATMVENHWIADKEYNRSLTPGRGHQSLPPLNIVEKGVAI